MPIDIQIDQTPAVSYDKLRAFPAIYEPRKGLTKPQFSIQRNSTDKLFGYVLHPSLDRSVVDSIENMGTRISSFDGVTRMATLSVKDYELLMSDYDVAAIENDHSQIARQFGW